MQTTTELQYIAETARATWWLVWATWALVVVTVGIAAFTVGVMRRQLRDSRAATQLNLHLQLVSDFESEAVSAVRSRVAATLLRHEQPAPDDIESILDRLESVAHYAHRKMLDSELVVNDFSYYARCYWHELSTYVLTQRSIRSDRTLFIGVEALEKTMQAEEVRSRGIPGVFPTDGELKAFLESEASTRDRFNLPRLHPPR